MDWIIGIVYVLGYCRLIGFNVSIGFGVSCEDQRCPAVGIARNGVVDDRILIYPNS
jgi:hypothetical protein